MASQGSPSPFPLHQLVEGHNGLALIITNDYHYRGSTMRPLTETHKDGEKMAQVLRGLKYITWLRQNVSHTQMQHLLHEVSQIRCPQSYCSIVIVFSGHGISDDQENLFIVTQDCKSFLVKYFVDPFMPKSSPLIATTHKVFLIDACLGERDTYRYAVTVPRGSGHTDTRSAHYEVESKGGKPVPTFDLPPEGNYILAFSTSIGYQSYEIMKQGGVWLNALAEKIRAKGHSESVVNILSEVTGDLIVMYQNPVYKNAMTQPHSIVKSHGTVYLVPQSPNPVGAPQGGSGFHLSSPATLNSKGQYRGQLNAKEQTKKISNLQYKDLAKSKNGLFLAEVTFNLTGTGKSLSFQSSAEKTTAREAREEAARIAYKYLESHSEARQVPKSAVKRQSSQQPVSAVKRQSSQQSLPAVKRQPSSDRNPLQRLKEGCEAQKPNYKFDQQEVPTNQHEQFQFRVIVTDGAGRELCKVTGLIQGSKQAAKHDAASKANAKLGF